MRAVLMEFIVAPKCGGDKRTQVESQGILQHFTKDALAKDGFASHKTIPSHDHTATQPTPPVSASCRVRVYRVARRHTA